MSTPGPVVTNLPPPAEAPAYRDSLSQLFEFAVHDFGSSVAVAPREGAGATRQYFTAERLCDARDELTDETWESLREYPPRDHDRTLTQQLRQWADSYIAADPTNMWRLLRAVRACVFAREPFARVPPGADAVAL